MASSSQGREVPEVRRVGFKDALYRGEELKRDGELVLGEGLVTQGDCEPGKPGFALNRCLSSLGLSSQSR